MNSKGRKLARQNRAWASKATPVQMRQMSPEELVAARAKIAERKTVIAAKREQRS